jgi:hypothetical protein
MDLIKFMFESFWKFSGVVLIITIILNGVATIIDSVFKGIALKKHGFPKNQEDTKSSLTDALQKLAKDSE